MLRRLGLVALALFSSAAVFAILVLCRPDTDEGARQTYINSATAADTRDDLIEAAERRRDGAFECAVSELALDVGAKKLTDAFDVRARTYEGDTRWIPTHVALDSFWLAWDLRERCNEQYAAQVEGQCAWRFDTVIEYRAPEVGEIVFVRARPASARERSPLGSDVIDDVRCPELIECIARSRLRQTIPIPDDEPSAVALTQYSVYVWPTSNELFTLSGIEKLHAVTKRSINVLRQMRDAGDLEAGVKLAEREDFVRFLGALIRRKREGA